MKQRKLGKKIALWLLCMVMVMSFMPMTVFALPSIQEVQIGLGSTMIWKAVPGAAYYSIRVDTGVKTGIGHFADRKAYGEVFSIGHYCDELGLATDEYTIYLTAKDAAGNALSETWVGKRVHFGSNKKLATPTNLHFEGEYGKWDPVPNATRYQVLLLGANGTYLGQYGITAESQYHFELSAGKQYKLMVIAMADNYVNGEATSNVYTFKSLDDYRRNITIPEITPGQTVDFSKMFSSDTYGLADTMSLYGFEPISIYKCNEDGTYTRDSKGQYVTLSQGEKFEAGYRYEFALHITLPDDVDKESAIYKYFNDNYYPVINGTPCEPDSFDYDEPYICLVFWMSPVIECRNHNFSSQTHKCTVCGETDPAYVSAPKITAQPVNVTATVGTTATFKIAATGDTLKYQWQYRNAGVTNWSDSGAAVAKTATMTFTVGTDKSLNGRQYRCIVTDKNGKSVTSNAATLTVAQPLTLTKQPANVTAEAGKSVTFSVTATGEGLTYQWQYRNAGATTWSNSNATAAKTANMTFTVGTDKTLNGRQYRCIVKDKYGKSVTSNAATLTVGTSTATLAITGQPANQTAAVGASVSFKVTATGEGLTYQWQYKSASASTWTSSGVAAAKTANMSFTVTDKNLSGRQYRCIVKDKNGNTVTSNAATLTVGTGSLAITGQPANQTAAVGEKVTFSVTAIGEGLTYQWQYRSASASTWTSSGVAAAKTANMNFTVTDKNLNGRQYRCIVTDKNGATVTSNVVTLTVGAGLAITSQPANQTAAVGASVSFKVTATGEGLTYQWQYKSASSSTWTSSGVAAAKTANMSFTVTDKNLNGRQYRCIVTDKNGKTVTSNAATLTVK